MVQEDQEKQKDLKKQYDEGLGTVYERFRLNYIFERLIKQYPIKRVLEYPIYGMTGVDGINSVYFAEKGIDVELVDCDQSRLNEVKSYWKLIGLENRVKFHFVPAASMERPKLITRNYDLVWNFAALWFYHQADKIIKRMIDLSDDLILISVNNPWQIGYPLRKYLLDKEFFIRNDIDTRWTQISRIKSILRTRGLEIVEEGVFDTPPWPDTCLPVAEIKKKLGIKVEENQESDWIWSMLAWYAGHDIELEKRVRRYMFIEDSSLPQFIKQFWSHHRYVLARHKKQ